MRQKCRDICLLGVNKVILDYDKTSNLDGGSLASPTAAIVGLSQQLLPSLHPKKSLYHRCKPATLCII